MFSNEENNVNVNSSSPFARVRDEHRQLRLATLNRNDAANASLGSLIVSVYFFLYFLYLCVSSCEANYCI